MTKQQEKQMSKLLERDAEGYDITAEEKEQHFRGIRIISDRPTPVVVKEQREENARKDYTIVYLIIALGAVGFFLLIML